MIRKVYDYIQKYHMIEKNDTIVIGVSGGADSVCLFSILLEIKKTIPFSLHVVHVNHQIRKEAGNDAKFVEDLCKEYRVPFSLIEKDVGAIARRERMSEEEAGRQVRYQAFEEIRDKLNLENPTQGKIAVAHNKNDRAETMLFHLFRGSDIKGMSGIAPKRDYIIRPLLCLERKEIEAYLKERNIPYCMDATNEEDVYTRNKIRHHMIPLAEEISVHAISHMNETAQKLEEAENYLTFKAAEERKRCCEEERQQISIDAEKFQEVDSFLQTYLIRDCIYKIAGNKKDITSKHIKDVMSLFTKQVGKFIILPYGIRAKRTYSQVILSNKEYKEAEETYKWEQNIEIPGNTMIDGVGSFTFTLLEASENLKIPEKTYTKWFDYDKIKKPLVLRNRKTGDYLTINEKADRKSLKQYLINEKIENSQRDKIVLLAEEDHVLWVVGHRISFQYKVTDSTKHILQVQFKGENKNG